MWKIDGTLPIRFYLYWSKDLPCKVMNVFLLFRVFRNDRKIFCGVIYIEFDKMSQKKKRIYLIRASNVLVTTWKFGSAEISSKSNSSACNSCRTQSKNAKFVIRRNVLDTFCADSIQMFKFHRLKNGKGDILRNNYTYRHTIRHFLWQLEAKRLGKNSNLRHPSIWQ